MMQWSRTSRHLVSVIRVQSLGITTSKLVRLDKPNLANKSTEHNIVAAAFASLKEIDTAKSKNASFHILSNKIDNATSVEDLLSITETKIISKQHALKVMSYNLYTIT